MGDKKLAKAIRSMPEQVAAPKMEPTMSMTEEMMPGMAKMKVGGKGEMTMNYEVMSLRKDQDGKITGELKVTGVSGEDSGDQSEE